MGIGEWIGTVIGVLAFLGGLVFGLIRFGRTIGRKEKDIEHTDQTLQTRIQALEDWKADHEQDVNSISELRELIQNNQGQIEEIMSKIQGGEFWERMKQILHEVKSGTERIKRSE